jgi:hypothetical protein
MQQHAQTQQRQLALPDSSANSTGAFQQQCCKLRQQLKQLADAAAAMGAADGAAAPGAAAPGAAAAAPDALSDELLQLLCPVQAASTPDDAGGWLDAAAAGSHAMQQLRVAFNAAGPADAHQAQQEALHVVRLRGAYRQMLLQVQAKHQQALCAAEQRHKQALVEQRQRLEAAITGLRKQLADSSSKLAGTDSSADQQRQQLSRLSADNTALQQQVAKVGWWVRATAGLLQVHAASPVATCLTLLAHVCAGAPAVTANDITRLHHNSSRRTCARQPQAR